MCYFIFRSKGLKQIVRNNLFSKNSDWGKTRNNHSLLCSQKEFYC